MQYVMTLVWSVLLMLMLGYVVSSVLAVPFDVTTSLILGVIFTVIVFIISAIIPNEPTPEADHH
ncbi:YjzD family protein [Ureibacillus aquaedulcis]|uniref:YjzD family protein n=1 Tax=Ureibacillus aquaedulcis TaxID=3058421 RepID=A0ABT8GLJ8_9BACL|nr:YjzD family protein [Ureibacillus sp. BA0131]MDN4492288.1 YjzD family protein [Ureibacillus sp. BA0131]